MRILASGSIGVTVAVGLFVIFVERATVLGMVSDTLELALL